ncbi:transcriptional attenuator, LytR family [Kytococcus aerolatus]|uniref:Transcriptional attenuator, LytR family n=1 Tax=Kytococcus aerolatus TaxID=592308 RepID=A0A212U5V8_9MICO|nr:LCP family protein [Kytococcus aerolatus]SNC73655.1 transcriptional attenuator, LytR family [Kytococcus aerolatus]
MSELHDDVSRASGAMPTGREGRPRRNPWRIGCGLLVLLALLTGIGGAVWVWNLNRTVENNIVHEALLPDEVEDGHPPGVRVDVDSDGDGKADTNLDTDGDGRPDKNLDSDHDGKADYRTDGSADWDGGYLEDEGGEPAPQPSGTSGAPAPQPSGTSGAPAPQPSGTSGAPAPRKSVAPQAPKDAEEKATNPDVDAEGARNVLIVGEDAGGGAQRSDVMILAHLNAAGDKATLIHFPRDLYVPIPGYGHNKLNAAYALGGAPLLTQTFQGALNVPVDDVVITDFDHFAATVDEVGGVTVDNPHASPKFGAGQVTLGSGSEALRFVRERKTLSQGDMGRGQRQMAVLQATAREAMSTRNPNRVNSVLDAATRNVRVSGGLTTQEIRSMGFDFLTGRGDIEYRTAPYAGLGWSPDGRQSIVIADWPGLRSLGDQIRNDTL